MCFLSEITFPDLIPLQDVKIEAAVMIIVDILIAVIIPYGLADHNICVCFLCPCHQRPVKVKGKIIITVHKGKIFSCCLLCSAHSCPKKSPVVFVVNKINSAVFFIFLYQLTDISRRAVIYNDNFQILITLIQYAFDTSFKILFCVIYWNNH